MKKIIFLLFVVSYCVTETAAAAEEAKRDSMFLGLSRNDVATYGTIAWSAGAVFMEFQWWWRDDYIYQQHPFRMKGDGYFYNSSYGVDKLGHMYASYLIFGLTYDVMKWADIDDNTALWAAIAVPASHAIAIEFGDGFSKYAFNVSDLYFNSTGILYGALQVKYPYLRNFTYKWSYYPSGGGGKNDPDWGPASDYSGHIYWLAMDMYNILPESVNKYWPKYLNLAVGLGAKNVSFGDVGIKKHKFAVALDWNTNAILPDGDTWNIFKNLINKIHLPAPGIKFYSSEKAVAKGLLLN
ncbi:MAG: DUF2279 domain-containing protein [Bacteroidota bacterium]|nr:DUF2279 domain-containing protein [Bacteroidota bacterium]